MTAADISSGHHDGVIHGGAAWVSSSGQTANTTVNGGVTLFSAAAETAGITVNSIYIITTAEQLEAVRNNLGADYKLGADINLSGYGASYDGGQGWQPIGTNSSPFTGSFDGSGYTISNLYINRPGTDDIGLFGYTNNAAFTNIHLAGVNITGRENSGGLVGNNYISPVSSSYSTGSITGDNTAGGLVGGNGGTVSSSYWNTETSGQATSAGGTGLTTAQMKQQSSFPSPAWDFSNVWSIQAGATYPYLQWQGITNIDKAPPVAGESPVTSQL